VITPEDAAALARQAVDLLAADIDVEIDEQPNLDPYQRRPLGWIVWPLLDGQRAFGIHVEAKVDREHALARMIDVLSEYSSESARFWGEPFPPCPGHAHPAIVGVDDEWAPTTVLLRCPRTKRRVGSVVPR